VSFQIVAIYNSTLCAFMINNATINGSKILIEVDSLESSEGEVNLTARTAYTTLKNLSVGKYSLEVREKSLGAILENTSFLIKLYGLFIDEDNLTATLGTFKGGIENDTLYLMPFPTVQVTPPGIFEHTNFWASSTEHFYLAFKFTNNESLKDQMIFSLLSWDENITISPKNCSMGTLNSTSPKLCILEVNNTNLTHGVYNLTYSLSYLDGVTPRLIAGTMPMGVYEISQS
ncbi:unnamed protein product, partial [marine sediment metagenome]